MAQHELLVKLGLQSDSFTRNLKNVNNQLKLTDVEFKKLQSSTSNFGSSQKDLESKLKSLSKTKEQLTAKTLLYKNKISELNTNIKESTSKHETLTNKLQNEKGELSRLEAEYGKTSEAYKIQKKVVKDVQEEYDKSKKKIENLNLSLQKHKISLTETETALNKLDSAISNTKFEKMTLHVTQATNHLDKLSSKLNSLSGKFGALGVSMTAGVTAPIVAAGKSLVSFGADFEFSMSRVKAQAGVSGDELEKLTAKAREMGKATSFTAVEAADGLGYMALAGWNTQQMLEGIEPVLRLAEAGEFDLALASDLVTDSMSSLGLEVSQLEDYLNKAALAGAISNTSVEQMLRTYNQVGGTFKRFNVPLAESGALIGVLGNRGLKAEQAGRSLSSLLINLTGGSTTANKALDALNVSAYDSKGKFRGIEEVLVDLHKELYKVENGTAKYTEEQRNSYLAMIGGKTQIRTLDALMAGVTETTANGATEFQNLKTQLENSDGALAEMAKTMKDNVKGDWERFTSMIGELALSINDLLAPSIRKILQKATELVEKFVEMDDSTKRFIVKAALIAASIGPAALALSGLFKVMSIVTGGMSTMMTFGVRLTKKIKEVSKAVKGGTSLFSALSGAIGGLPAIIAIAVAALVGIATVLGENESALAMLQEKWGMFGTFIGGVCESIAGIVQMTIGNLIIGLGTLGEVIIKALTLQWGDIDEVIKEGGAKIAKNSNKAFSNMTMESTGAIYKLRQMTSSELNGLVGDMELILNTLPGVTYDTADALAEKFATGLSKLDNTSIQILSSTSDTMNTLFRGINENMSNDDAVRQYTKNLQLLAQTGGVEFDTLKMEIDKTLDLINNNMADSGDRFAREAKVAMEKFNLVTTQGVDQAADDIASHLSGLNTVTIGELQNMGNNWGSVFKNIKTDGTMTTGEMATIIEDNIRRLAKNNPKFIEQLQTEMKSYLDKLPEDANTAMTNLTGALTTGSEAAANSTAGTGEKIEENLSFDAENTTLTELQGMQTAINDSTPTLKESANNLGTEISSGYDFGLSGLNTTTTQKMLEQAANIQSGGQQSKAAMQDNAVQSIEGFIQSWDSNSGRINESIQSTFDNFTKITKIDWSGTTSNLNSLNTGLSNVSKNSKSAKADLSSISKIGFNGTVSGFRQIAASMNSITGLSKSVRSAIVSIANVSLARSVSMLKNLSTRLREVESSAKKAKTPVDNVAKIDFKTINDALTKIITKLINITNKCPNVKTSLSLLSSISFATTYNGLNKISNMLSSIINRAISAKSAMRSITSAAIAASAASATVKARAATIDKMDILSRQIPDISTYDTSSSYLSQRDSIEKGIVRAYQQNAQTDSLNNNNELIAALQRQNELLIQLLTSDRDIVIQNELTIDGRKFAKSTARHTRNELSSMDNRFNRLGGK